MAGCVIYEDEHLLVVDKPAGWNTHSPSPYAGEGIYEWLRDREPSRATLAIIHRLDKETSGVMVFAKTAKANRSLTDQFTRRAVTKKYLLLSDRGRNQSEFTIETCLVRAGARYVSRPRYRGGELATTRFRFLKDVRLPAKTGDRNDLQEGLHLFQAEPLTGRTHQIRVHAAESGFPILGDALYGGSPWARLCLQAAGISFAHPATNEAISFQAVSDFQANTGAMLRQACIVPEQTDAFRVLHGASDGWPGWYLDKLGPFLLSQSEAALTPDQLAELERRSKLLSARGAYHKQLSRRVRKATPAESSPQPVQGEPAPERFRIRENGLQFELSFGEGYSVGLFLDQRDNRRRLLAGYVGAKLPRLWPPGRVPEVLNAFAYTCGFSVCAARAGARVTSLDLSRKYLDWGRRNFELNGLDSAGLDFIYGDVFDWLRRLARKGRRFDLVILDPPTFSQSKESGVFRAERDYGKLFGLALSVTNPGGVVLASTNAAGLAPADFLGTLAQAARRAGRKLAAMHYAPQPPDFPVSRDEPAYLKTVWLKLDQAAF